MLIGGVVNSVLWRRKICHRQHSPAIDDDSKSDTRSAKNIYGFECKMEADDQRHKAEVELRRFASIGFNDFLVEEAEKKNERPHACWTKLQDRNAASAVDLSDETQSNHRVTRCSTTSSASDVTSEERILSRETAQSIFHSRYWQCLFSLIRRDYIIIRPGDCIRRQLDSQSHENWILKVVNVCIQWQSYRSPLELVNSQSSSIISLTWYRYNIDIE